MKNNTVKQGTDIDVAVSSRVRLARNLSAFPFPERLGDEDRKKVAAQVTSALKGVFGTKLDIIDFSSLSPMQARSYVEYHAASPDFLNGKGARELVILDDISVCIMINEEDHIRLQSILPGLAIDSVFEMANRVDDVIEGGVEYAFSESLGYLTHCPTNLGTGMRASVMLHLPALTMTKQIKQLAGEINKLGLVIRGFYGEGTSADGGLYQVSNQVTLGLSEEQIIENLKVISGKLIEMERKTRKELLKQSGDMLRDKVMRSYGIMRSCHMMSSAEFFDIYSDVRLGIATGLIEGVDYQALDALLLDVQPANISLKINDSENRDVYRAKYIKDFISGQQKPVRQAKETSSKGKV